MMYEHFASFQDTNPWHARGLMVQSAFAFMTEALSSVGLAHTLLYNRAATADTLAAMLITTVVVTLYTFFSSYILWPFLPRFLCDLYFDWVDTFLAPAAQVIQAGAKAISILGIFFAVKAKIASDLKQSGDLANRPIKKKD